MAHASSVNCVKIGRRSSIMVTGGDDKRVNMWAIGKPHALLVRFSREARSPARSDAACFAVLRSRLARPAWRARPTRAAC